MLRLIAESLLIATGGYRPATPAECRHNRPAKAFKS